MNPDTFKMNMFKGSISVIVIYTVVILLMVLLGIFSKGARDFIFVNNFAFTAVFIGGTMFVVALIVLQLYYYSPKPVEETEVKVDHLTCPDYWELKPTTDAMKRRIQSKYQTYANYVCEAPSDSVNSGGPLQNTAGSVLTNLVDDFNDSVDASAQITCGRIYPEYMAYHDLRLYPDEPNTLRCEYIQQCGSSNVTWSSICSK